MVLSGNRGGFSAHMSCTVTLRPVVAECACRAQNDIPEKSDGRHLKLSVCMRAQNTHVKGITAPPRVIRLCAIDTARSTIKPRPQKRTVSANPCSVFTNVPFATLSHKMCPPVLAHRCASCELASDLERRTGVRNQRCPEAPRQPEKDG